MKKYDIAALGELLIDFTENGTSENGNPVFEANPGGAPCNVLAMMNKLGKKAAFIGKVGDDMFGRQLAEVLCKAGISTEGLVTDNNYPTTLAFVHTLEGGEREFSFIRNPGADMMLDESEVSFDIIENSRIFHFGTLSSTHEGVRRATRKAIEKAEKSGTVISFDPNLREPLWNNLNDAKTEMEYGISKCDILKISDNEIEFLLGHCDYNRAAEELLKKYRNLKIIFITLGSDGSRAFTRNAKAEAPVFDVNTIEKTGAGDTFFGCVLSFLADCDPETLSEEQLADILLFSNAGASLITTRKGALKVMPEREEIINLCGKLSTLNKN